MIRNQFRFDLNEELIVDNFAGGRDASTGIELGLGWNVDIAINHNRFALTMHEANHPQTRHIPEDVFLAFPLPHSRVGATSRTERLIEEVENPV